MKSIAHAALAGALAALCTAAAAAATLNHTDRSYLTSAMQSQLGRYAIASLAEKNGTAPVKAYAKTMAAEAAAETRTLDAIAKQQGIPPAKHPGMEDSYHYSQLSGLHGAAFDRQFVMDTTISDDLLKSTDRREAAHGSDPRLKAFARHRLNAIAAETKKLAKL